MAFALLLSVVVVVYNNVVNRWPPFHGSAYVPLNLLFAVTVTVVSASAMDVGGPELGLEGDVGDLFIPVALLVPFALILFGIASSRHARLIADRRVAGMHGSTLAFYTLVRIPLGTAVAEEVMFRGVLYAVWLDTGLSSFSAAQASSVAFGLWHISPTINGVLINDPGASNRKIVNAVIGAVLFTTFAGLGLTWLRVGTSGLLAPIVLHAGVNAVGALAAVRADSARTIPDWFRGSRTVAR
ncbi:MAG: CPBP family intramembrane glutamic endopeptidase [Actinomycetota bacterium]